MDLVNGAGLRLDRSRIPESLHELIHLVEKWGFESQDDQDQFLIEMQNKNPSEVLRFNREIDQARASILTWGNTLTELNKHKSTFDEAAWNHPYWSFLSALKIRELTEPSDAQEVSEIRKQMSSEARTYHFKEVAEKAADEFRKKQYEKFIELLMPFEDLLSDSQRKKVGYANRQIEKS